MAAGGRLKTGRSGVILQCFSGGGYVAAFSLLLHQDAGVGPGDGQGSQAAHSGLAQEVKGQTQNLEKPLCIRDATVRASKKAAASIT